MGKYPVIKPFKDLEDEKFLYGKDVKEYPREGVKVAPERTKALQEKGYLGEMLEVTFSMDNTVDELKAELNERGVDYDTKAPKKDLLALLDDEDGGDQ